MIAMPVFIAEVLCLRILEFYLQTLRRSCVKGYKGSAGNRGALKYKGLTMNTDIKVRENIGSEKFALAGGTRVREPFVYRNEFSYL